MKLMEGAEDGIMRLYSVCGNCEGKIRTIGEPDLKTEQLAEEVIVV